MKDKIKSEIEYFSKRYHYNTDADLKPQIIELLKKPEAIIMVEAMKDILGKSLRRVVVETIRMFEKEESKREVQIANGEYCKGYFARVKENNQLAKSILQDIFSRQTIPTLQEEKEIVICAAIRMHDGYIVRGHRHADAIATARGIPKYANDHKWGGNQGFVTSRNRFVNRVEGAQIQKAAGIVSKMPENGAYLHGELYSEDLY